MNDAVLITRALHFAAERHSNQRRKGQAQEPYINHLAEVAALVVQATKGEDANLVAAALLHDTIEDTATQPEELASIFNHDVAALVQEVTDNKSLTKKNRKDLQVTNAPKNSRRAKILKLADKTSNLRSIANSPPENWDKERKREYIQWSMRVADGLNGVNAWLEERFQEALKEALQTL